MYIFEPFFVARRGKIRELYRLEFVQISIRVVDLKKKKKLFNQTKQHLKFNNPRENVQI